MKRQVTVPLIALFGLVFVVEFLLVDSTKASGLDSQVFTALNGLAANPLIATISGILTQFGSEVILALMGVAILVLDKKKWRFGAEVLIAIAVADGVIALVKGGYFRERPYQILPGVNLPLGIINDSGFPSAHVTRSFAVSTVFAIRFGRKAVPIYLLSFLVGISRIILGVHFPLDVVGGTLLGLSLGLSVPLVSDIVRQALSKSHKAELE